MIVISIVGTKPHYQGHVALVKLKSKNWVMSITHCATCDYEKQVDINLKMCSP